MPLHPSPPSTFAETVDAWAGTVRAVADLGRTMRPEDAALPTDCPGWTVGDQIAHVVSAEAGIAGEQAPEIDVSAFPHVRHEFGAYIERLVESRRGRALEDVLDELEERLAERADRYRAEGVTGEESVVGPFGPTRLADLAAIRTFDVWVHEQDIREALDRPGGLDTPAAALSISRLFAALPRIVAKDAGIEPGQAVVLELTGPTIGRAGVRVQEQDGRAMGVPLFTGDAEERAGGTTTLTMSTQVAGRLLGGRRDPGELHVVVSGDADVARRVLAAMAITP